MYHLRYKFIFFSVTKAKKLITLMKPSIDKGFLLNRSIEQIQDNIDDFLTIKKNSEIIACAGLREYHEEKIAEIYAFVVAEKYQNTGLSSKLIVMLNEKAKSLGFDSLFAVSKYGGSFFIRNGFEIAKIEDLPLQRQKNYDYKRLSSIYIKKNIIIHNLL